VKPKKPRNIVPQDDIRHPDLHNTKTMYVVPTQANVPVEVVPAGTVMTEREMGIALLIVILSPVLRRVVSFTDPPLYFPAVRVPFTN
jgi:hypothetical protein